MPPSLSYPLFAELAVRIRKSTDVTESQACLKSMQTLILSAFSDVNILNASFLSPDACSTNLGLDVGSIRSFYELIVYLVRYS
jgi:hypothetical protein